jgi:hypothetical protein
MKSLEHYTGTQATNIVHFDRTNRFGLRPGDRCRETMFDSDGIVIAISKDECDITVLWSVLPSLSFPRVKSSNYQIAQSMVQVQPMTAPMGSIFYIDYKYGSGSKK